MATGDRKDPHLAFNFLVEIEDVAVAGFTEVSGLQIEIEVKDYREGGWNAYVYKLPGPTRYPSNLVLKRGFVDEKLWNWYQDVMAGRIERKKVDILLLDGAGEETWRWEFEGAYPVRWVGPELRAGTAQVAVETLELVHGPPQR
jgi:phage tail-like protein